MRWTRGRIVWWSLLKRFSTVSAFVVTSVSIVYFLSSLYLSDVLIYIICFVIDRKGVSYINDAMGYVVIIHFIFLK